MHKHACLPHRRADHKLNVVNLLQGCSYDHVELNFYLNGKSLNQAVRGIKGSIFPAFYGKKPELLWSFLKGTFTVDDFYVW